MTKELKQLKFYNLTLLIFIYLIFYGTHLYIHTYITKNHTQVVFSNYMLQSNFVTIFQHLIPTHFSTITFIRRQHSWNVYEYFHISIAIHTLKRYKNQNLLLRKKSYDTAEYLELIE